MNYCPFCNEELEEKDAYCSSCKANIELIHKRFYINGYESLESIVYYNDFFREHLFNYKFGINKKYLPAFAAIFEEEIKRLMKDNKIDYITSVPMNKDKLKKKGFDHMREILKLIAKDMDLEMYSYEKAEVKDMHKLSFSERTNIRGIFKKGTDVNNKNILIIDDIITTGTTMKDSLRAMKEAGFDKVYGLILCSRR